MESAKHIALIKKHLVETYNPLPVVLAHGNGAVVWDVDGRDYIDMLSCYSALNAGHCHPRIVKALCLQAQELDGIARAFYHDQFGPFLREAAEFCGKEKILPMNVGVEGWEKAIKAIRKWAYTVKGIKRYKAEIILCANNFHGRTITAISASSERHYRYNFGPFTPGFKLIPFGDAKALEAAIGKNTAAFVIEPIQAEAGIIIPHDGYLIEAREICRRNNILFVLDEIQTGLGRTGKHFAWQWEDAEPDIIILGKFLGGGLYPVSLVAGNAEVLDVFDPGEDGSTFSGNPLACAVAREALRVLQEERLAEKALLMGTYFLGELKKISSPFIKEVRGKGLLIGIELRAGAGGARRFCNRLMEAGVLCKEAHKNVIRLAPPLNIDQCHLDWALARIERALKE
ncbi:MAG: ornithine--oxo-acid transaminase [Candidatus Wildermuthbacteria bacterium RIFCSPLOWO2_01_FULL_48_35]|uniref:ornithine aminotransferase n=2 Tax=Candidatus Wildermuthiibacteriota TaxID=1817923 RepID=A0A1G2RSA1_9BACT|nr:MAG: ornithine--oxo-acid transaminase [Candidatus Wildermuthbacteria bacterium RIFCSPHIGHO2_02_FULL_47_17]OHA75726.1 MAG: ornithine--oxo-acid transaminase [Candidatus Wildermuthbacteria bacterium RIFCSPLOWO2_01_FULL_48_35]